MKRTDRASNRKGELLYIGFDGRRDPASRAKLDKGEQVSLDPAIGPFLPYRKTSVTYAVRIDVPFRVRTLEGEMYGRSGDYLAVGGAGEMYVVAEDIFQATYDFAPVTSKDQPNG
jgi:hypothetical protein